VEGKSLKAITDQKITEKVAAIQTKDISKFIIGLEYIILRNVHRIIKIL
jgi:hypothetical protein